MRITIEPTTDDEKAKQPNPIAIEGVARAAIVGVLADGQSVQFINAGGGHLETVIGDLARASAVLQAQINALVTIHELQKAQRHVVAVHGDPSELEKLRNGRGGLRIAKE